MKHLPESKLGIGPTTPPQELERLIRTGDPRAYEALDLLARMAQSGDKTVCTLVNQLDEDFEAGILHLPSEKTNAPSQQPKFSLAVLVRAFQTTL